MIKSYGKINLSLDILSKREDGYHNIDTIMTEVDLYDELRIEKTKGPLEIQTLQAEIPFEDHLLKKTYDEMKVYLPEDVGFSIELTKNIPIGAGLGGGSSNAGAFISYLIEEFQLEISKKELKEICEKLGADIFFFLEEGMARAKGTGADLKRIEANFKKPVLIINPGIFISSREVYEGLSLNPKDEIDLVEDALLKEEDLNLGEVSYNKMEERVFEMYPEILEIKKSLKEKGAFLSLMSGAGSSVFGLFESVEERDQAFKSFYNKYPFVYKGWTR